MIACTACGTENPEVARFCLSCGNQLEPPPPNSCWNCGTENPDAARFCLACGSALAPELPAQEVRKTVTIVFSDLKGSTSLGEALDPESLREVMTQYFDGMRAELERHGGTIEKYIGDAVMAVFGLPRLHEDDALRAVRAAAGMQAALARLNDGLERRWGVRLVNRTGVNTGEVVAGDPTTGQRLVTGDAVNVAARLEQAAGACEVLLGESTYRLVRHLVEVEPVEPLELKGKSERVPAYRLLGVGLDEADAIARRSDSPLVGRAAELARLEDEFEDATVRGVCRLVTILGEAGLGKSRLTEEFLRGVEPRANVLRGRCLPYGRGITFWPLVEIVREAAAIAEDDPPAAARAKLLVLAEGDAHVADRVASAIGIHEQHFSLQELFWGTRKLLETVARAGPVVLVFEDIHWAETTLLDLIEHVNESVVDLPILIVCGARPTLLELRPAWSQGRTSGRIELRPLSDAESALVIENLLGHAGLPAAAQARIVAAAEGNPLFAEQMLSMLIEEGHLRSEDGRWSAVGDLSDLVIPPTINALLTARLDLLSREERSVIDPASVVGVAFQRDAVAELAPEPVGTVVDVHLQGLEAKQLVRQQAEPAEERWFRFHHILIKDAAYGGLLKRARASFHERFVDWAERVNRGRDRELEFEEILGYHLEQAFRYLSELGPLDDHGRGLGERAFERLRTAGRRAFARGDMPAASNLLRRAVELLPEGDGRRLALLPDLSEAMLEVGELAWADLYVEEAATAAAARGDNVLGAHATVGRLLVARHSGDDDGWSSHVLEDAEAAIAVLEDAHDHGGLAKAYRLLYFAHGTACRFAEFQDAAELAGRHARIAGDRRLETRSLTNHATAALYGPTPVPEAIHRCQEILLLADGDRRTTGIVTSILAETLALNGDFEQARRTYLEGRSLLDDLGRGIVSPSTALQAGWIELRAGDFEAAERRLREAYEQLTEMRETYFAPSLAALLADALHGLDRDVEAEEFARIAARRSAEDDVATQAQWRSALARIRAERDGDAALVLAREAVELLRPTDAAVWQADALAALADVCVRLGGHEEAAAACAAALDLYDRKQAVAPAARLRAQPAPVRL